VAHPDALSLLLVDGDNLLHDVRGGRDDGGVAWLLPRLARWRPPDLRIVVALDGHPAHGDASRRRAARGIEFHHAGGRSADDLIIDLLTEQPFLERASTVVVTGDRGLAERARRNGGLARPVTWLMACLEEAPPAPGRHQARPAAGSIARTKPLRGAPAPSTADEAEPAPWRPGRGATRKRGNPRRGTRATRRR
jgi:hypothetical protein